MTSGDTKTDLAVPFEMCDFLFQTKYMGIPALARAFDHAIAQ
jgi:hypothetical protein